MGNPADIASPFTGGKACALLVTFVSHMSIAAGGGFLIKDGLGVIIQNMKA